MKKINPKMFDIYEVKPNDTLLFVLKKRIKPQIANEISHNLAQEFDKRDIDYLFTIDLFESISELNIDELKRMRNRLQEEINKLEIKEAIKEKEGDNI